MNYKFRATDGTTQIIQILSTTFKRLKVWKLYFDNSDDVMLYKIGNQWLQRSEDSLEEFQIILIGDFIDAQQKTVTF